MTEALDETSLPIGSAAAQLGVAPETLRSWGRRYGLLPSARTRGGHRRYSAADLARLVRMQHLVAGGLSPARAALAVLAEPDDPNAAQLTLVGRDVTRPLRRRPGGPGGRVLAVPNAPPESRGLARAASRLDAEGMGEILRDLLGERGAARTWQIVCPILVAVGERWQSSGDGVEIEHLLSEVLTDALRGYRASQLRPVPGRPVVLACFPEDTHVLPLQVLAATLAEQRIPVRLLGARVPVPALNAAIRRTGASAVFIWRQLAGEGSLRGLDIPRTRPPVRLFVGGPGWDGAVLPPGARRAGSLQEATNILRATVR